ncbi:MAG: hypothetical protein GX556_13905 [Fibrobacter sp.]|nr:hypothetical protein [Fibrobacter sp.]
MRKTSILLQITLFIAALLILGCGGGFKSDSEAADDLGETIFGPDSLH